MGEKNVVVMESREQVEDTIRQLGFTKEDTIRALTNLVCYILGIMEDVPEDEKRKWQELDIMEGDSVLVDEDSINETDNGIELDIIEVILFGLAWEGLIMRVDNDLLEGGG